MLSVSDVSGLSPSIPSSCWCGISIPALLPITADKACPRDRGVVVGSQRLCPRNSELSGPAWALFSVSIGKGCCLPPSKVESCSLLRKLMEYQGNMRMRLNKDRLHPCLFRLHGFPWFLVPVLPGTVSPGYISRLAIAMLSEAYN